MTSIYLMSIDETEPQKYLEEQVHRLNFELQVKKGHVPSKSVVWMPKRREGNDLNIRMYHVLDRCFNLEQAGIKLEEGLNLPEGWLWHDTYQCILIVDGHDQIVSLLKRMLQYVDGVERQGEYREGFIYRLKSYVKEERLKMLDEGLLYGGIE